jgi:hypothetical protein
MRCEDLHLLYTFQYILGTDLSYLGCRSDIFLLDLRVWSDPPQLRQNGSLSIFWILGEAPTVDVTLIVGDEQTETKSVEEVPTENDDV